MIPIPQKRGLLHRIASLCEQFQWLTLCLLVLVTANSYRLVLWQVPFPKANVLAEWQGIVLYPADVALLILFLVSVARLITDATYAAQIAQTFHRLFTDQYAWLWVLLVIWGGLGVLWAEEPNITR